MRTYLVALALSSAFVISAAASDERAHQRDLCRGMRQEVTLPNGARVDCLSATHAIEVEFSENWAEALGQSLLYAANTELKPGIFLICRQKPRNCLAHRLRLDEALAACLSRYGRSNKVELAIEVPP